MSDRPPEFIVIFQQAWMNASGFGINYSWDRVRFTTRERAIKHGLKERGSDDFNIAEVDGQRLAWFGWMDEQINENDETMAEIAEAIGLQFEVAP
jgi:hypothetical protein